MPIVGSFAGASARAYGAGAGGLAVPAGFNSIATTTITDAGGVTSVVFSAIPSTYKHLQIRYISRTPSNSDNMVMQFNSDTATNYSTHYFYGNQSSVASGNATSSTYMFLDVLTASSTFYSTGVVDILDYANTNKFKTVRSLAGINLNGSGTVWIASGNWRNTNAVSSITLKTSADRTISQYSHFALYGIVG